MALWFSVPKRNEVHGIIKKYDALNGALKAYYETNTTSSDNAQNKDIPEATIEAYMILLFEIARRLVKSENHVSDRTPRKKEYDVLPIGSAIVRFKKLLESSNYRFEDVFLKGARFHCFSGKPVERRKKIEAINEATAKKETVTKEQLLKELQELFCSDQRLKEISSVKGDQLAKTSKDFKNMSLDETLSDAESYTAFDYCK